MTAPSRHWSRAPDQRRRQLLDAAFLVFLEEGTAATVWAITARAGVSKGTFYVYFESKEELLAQLREELLTDYDASLATDGPPSLEEMVRVSIEFLSSELHNVLFPTAVDQARGQRAVIDGFATFLEESNAAGTTDVKDPHTIAVLMVGAVNFAVRYLQDSGAYDPDRLVAGVLEMHQRMLRPSHH